MLHFKLGTRSSPLALWQAYFVKNLLEKQGASVELITFETKGDKVLDQALAKIGSKGLFTEELEISLRKKEIDFAVHSAKDVQSVLDDDLHLIAFTEREIPNDVLISEDKNITLKNISKNDKIGTSSTRRKAILKHYYPELETADVRGNLQTRRQKLLDGQYKALILAYAGVVRSGFEAMIVEKLPLTQFTPAVGQGSIALQVAQNLEKDKKEFLTKHINHQNTWECLSVERDFLATLEGGCSIPIFGYAEKKDEEIIHFSGGIISLDGQEIIRVESEMKKNYADFGKKMAKELLEKGGDKILYEIKNSKK